MKYIRTKNGIYENKPLEKHLGRRQGKGFEIVFKEEDIIEKADTIEELCDEFVYVDEEIKQFLVSDDLDIYKAKQLKVFGAIWTSKGLIYVAKMNEKGKWELL